MSRPCTIVTCQPVINLPERPIQPGKSVYADELKLDTQKQMKESRFSASPSDLMQSKLRGVFVFKIER